MTWNSRGSVDASGAGIEPTGRTHLLLAFAGNVISIQYRGELYDLWRVALLGWCFRSGVWLRIAI